jgi:Ca2+-binding EF-hand superfamily protein
MLDDSMLRMTIDPLLHSLATCSTTPQLHQRLTHLFEVIDLDESKSISFEEMQVGFNKLASVVPGARVGDILSMEEFEAISRGGEYVNAAGEMILENFKTGTSNLLLFRVRHVPAIASPIRYCLCACLMRSVWQQ